ncbi:cytochrome c4 [Aquincola sp. MAHUQ-54]|uniref:Cytochrome c4 n=1 Tax=Aquincola agrisoli TaxID=3119538 RepID=A0AAW9PZW7_9BURK
MQASDQSARRAPGWAALAACIARAGVTLLLAANVSAAQDLPDTLGQRMQACMGCHGNEGRATNHGYLPRIAGKPAGYLYNQLVNFREGRRPNADMAALLQHMTDDYLRDIAGYFAASKLPYPPPQTTGADAAVLSRGQALVRQGDAAQGIPACVQCHGAAMTGVRPSVPGLLGLPRDYLLGQLGAWRSGQRRAASPDCMAHIARQLQPADVGALATWLSSQPVPGDAEPADGLPLPPPADCGSGLP